MLLERDWLKNFHGYVTVTCVHAWDEFESVVRTFVKHLGYVHTVLQPPVRDYELLQPKLGECMV